MMLQDTGDPSSDSFADNPYLSDTDPYSTASTSPTTSPRFDASQLPQPIPVVGPLLGYSQTWVRYKTETTLRIGEEQVQRRLTPEEAQALAQHLYKLEQIKSYWTTFGVAWGGWRAYKTMGTYRYPFYTPKIESINPDKFWIFKGRAAQFARHSWRTSVWVAISMQVGMALGTVIAQSAAAQASANDPKLAHFSADLKEAMSRRGIGQAHREISTQQHPGAGPAQQRPPHAGAPRWPRRSPQPAPPQAAQSDDDMSPTSGNEPWSADGYYGDSSFPPDAVETQQKQPPRYTAQQPRPPRRRQDRPTGDDDSSPTGGLFQEEPQNQSNPNESTWDRLRRGAGPTSGQGAPLPSRRQEPPRREKREEQNLGDSWTFSESNEERRAAQIKAQREFDERLERERQGKEFDDRRW
jgi:hypothetical protein